MVGGAVRTGRSLRAARGRPPEGHRPGRRVGSGGAVRDARGDGLGVLGLPAVGRRHGAQLSDHARLEK